jgi:CD63 antigen
MVEGGMKCVKYLLFAFNLIFFLAGLGLIIAGALVQTKFNAYFDFFGGQFSAAAILLIVVGAVIFIIGFFGCCGAYKENYCMVMTFAILLGLIFILEIAAGVTAYVLRDKVNSIVLENLTRTQAQYSPDNQGVMDTWDQAQRDFECCGVRNYTDWSGKGSIPTGGVPESCCLEGAGDCTSSPGRDNVYQDGCMMKFTAWIEDNIFIIGGVGIGLAFVQIMGIVLAVCLGRSIKKEYEVV